MSSISMLNPYLGDFGNVRERHFWTKNPTRIIVSRFGDFLKNLILGTELASFLDKKSNENFKILILGFELASFSDKKSRCVWERQGASFLDKKSNANYCIKIWGFFKKKFILGTELASFSDKKTRPHSIAL